MFPAASCCRRSAVDLGARDWIGAGCTWPSRRIVSRNRGAVLGRAAAWSLIDRQPFGRMAVDVDDDVVLLDAGFIGRAVGNDVVDAHVSWCRRRRGSTCRCRRRSPPSRPLVERGEILGLQEDRVAVLHRTDHAVDRLVADVRRAEPSSRPRSRRTRPRGRSRAVFAAVSSPACISGTTRSLTPPCLQRRDAARRERNREAACVSTFL